MRSQFISQPRMLCLQYVTLALGHLYTWSSVVTRVNEGIVGYGIAWISPKRAYFLHNKFFSIFILFLNIVNRQKLPRRPPI